MHDAFVFVIYLFTTLNTKIEKVKWKGNCDAINRALIFNARVSGILNTILLIMLLLVSSYIRLNMYDIFRMSRDDKIRSENKKINPYLNNLIVLVRHRPKRS